MKSNITIKKRKNKLTTSSKKNKQNKTNKRYKKNQSRKRQNKKKGNHINIKNINYFSEEFNKIPANKVFKNVNTKDDFKKLLIKSDYAQNQSNKFKKFIDIDLNLNATDQKYSGRCWLFAFLNLMRYKMIKKYNLDNFEFSQNYLFFYDKLEKANFFLNYIINTIDIDHTKDDKLVYLLTNLTNDGGQWNMFVNLINKYGIIPKSNMDDHYHSENSEQLNSFFNDFLKVSAFNIRNMNKNELNKNKSKILTDILNECYKILTMFLGEPPKNITWDYYTKTKKGKKVFKSIKNVTPLNFYKKHVPYNVDDKICLINYPCQDKPFYKLYNIDSLYNIFGDKDVNFINVPNDIMIQGIKKSIDNDDALWVGMDPNKFISNKFGFLDENAFNYKDIFGFDNIINKCDSLEYRISVPQHAVVIKGYNFDKGNTNGFLVENSWGKHVGFEGNYYMALEWFKKFNFEVVIDKKYVSKKIRDILKQKPILLPYNSPFGSLLFS